MLHELHNGFIHADDSSPLTITCILRDVIEHLEDGDSDPHCKYKSTQI